LVVVLNSLLLVITELEPVERNSASQRLQLESILDLEVHNGPHEYVVFLQLDGRYWLETS
jgi:hypothetical protein